MSSSSQVLGTVMTGAVLRQPAARARGARSRRWCAGVCVVTVVTLLVSCLLSTVATGISVLMAYGAGLVAGLLGEIGRSLDATTLTRIADGVCYALPFEALYRDSLSRLTPAGLAGQIVQLGPLGGARGGGVALWVYTLCYVVACGALAVWVFSRSDL